VDVREVELSKLLKQAPVEIVLLNGCWPGVNSSVWTSPDFRCMLWFHSSSSCLVVPQGWLLDSHALAHSELGGVTNGAFWCRMAHPVESKPLVWPIDLLTVSSFLNQVVDPTLGGPLSEHKPEFKNRELNTASGLLDWKKWFDRVLLPMVYSKVQWAK
jgi:hypothetical protein